MMKGEEHFLFFLIQFIFRYNRPVVQSGRSTCATRGAILDKKCNDVVTNIKRLDHHPG